MSRLMPRRPGAPSHFKDEVWLDYVRGLAPDDARRRIADHLASGCGACNLSVRFFERIAQVLRRDGVADGPEAESAYREVLALFRRGKGIDGDGSL